MGIELLLPLLKSKWTWIAGAFIALGATYYLHVQTLNIKVGMLKVEVAEYASSLKTAQNNFDTVVKVNTSNMQTIKKLDQDVKELEKMNEIIIAGKEKEIIKLKDLIKEMNEPVVYPDEANFENVTIKIKESPDENDTTFTILNNIGS